MADLQKRTLFVFSDPGGAKPVLSLAEKCGRENCLVVSDRYHSFFSDFNADIRIISPDDALNIIDEYRPELLFTATSYRSDIEKIFLEHAARLGIYSCSFIDHWTSFLARFSYNDNLLFPQEIHVIDDRARTISIKEGLPVERLVITGNPYHEKLRRFVPETDRAALLGQMGIDPATRLIVYAPDPLSNINGSSIYGFDEYSATRMLVNVFKKKDWKVLVKMHPNQDREKLESIYEGNPAFITVPDHLQLNTVIYHADVIMGYFSSFLIEAEVLGKRVIRYLPFGIKNDPIAEMHIGCIGGNDDLTDLLNN